MKEPPYEQSLIMNEAKSAIEKHYTDMSVNRDRTDFAAKPPVNSSTEKITENLKNSMER